MYLKPAIYRVYSIFNFVSSILLFISFSTISVIYAIAAAVGSTNFLFSEFLPDELSSALLSVLWLGSLIIFICALICLFFGYVHFSSMICFADMIAHEKSGETTPFKKRFFVMSPKAYLGIGNVMFTIKVIVGILASVIIVIAQSIISKSFIALPLIPLGLIAIDCFVTYITWCAKYKAFSDALEVKRLSNQSELPAICKESLKENKTGLLRGWCTTLFVLCIVETIIYGVAIFLIARYVPSDFKALLIISMIPSWLITMISYGIEGCFFDNLATMVERILIKHNLYRNANKSVKCPSCKATISGENDYCGACGTKADR